MLAKKKAMVYVNGVVDTKSDAFCKELKKAKHPSKCLIINKTLTMCLLLHAKEMMESF